MAIVLLASCAAAGGPSTLARITGKATDSSAQLNALSASVEHAKVAVFKAVYTTGGDASQAATIEQKPPKVLYRSAGQLMIDNGTTTYTCLTFDSTLTCTSAPGPGNLSDFTSAYSPGAMISSMRSAQAHLGDHLGGFGVTMTKESFAGLPATCMKVDANALTEKYCVTNDGILAYSGPPGSGIELTSYSTDVPDSDFSLPAGAILTPGP